MQKRQVLRNAVMSIFQIIGQSILLFILYRFLLDHIGIKALGIWSVVMATTSVAQIANMGLSASVLRFVAKYLALNKEEEVSCLIQTAVISLASIYGLILFAIFFFSDGILGLIVPAASLRDALSIFPFALASLWISVISSVYQAGLDGYQRIDLRNMFNLACSLLYLLLCIILVPTYGLKGVAYSQVTQAFASLVCGWFLLKRYVANLPLIPLIWNRKLFREMASYGGNLQVISVSVILYDPITKGLLTKFGGLAMTGFFEMASRMIYQLRAILGSANQVLVPSIAELKEREPGNIQKIYKDSYRLIVYLSVPFYFAAITLIPVISEIWIGHYDRSFVLFSYLLAVGWFINTLCGPGYVMNLGTGELRWSTVGHVTIVIANLGLGLFLGGILGGVGVVAAWVLSLIAGSLVISLSYHFINGIPLAELFPRENKGVGLTSIAGLAISLIVFHELNDKLAPLALLGMTVFIFSALVMIPFFRHPMNKRLTGWISAELLNRS